MVDSLKPDPNEERVGATEESEETKEDRKDSFLESWSKFQSSEVAQDQEDSKEQSWWQKLTDKLFKSSVDMAPLEPAYAEELAVSGETNASAEAQAGDIPETLATEPNEAETLVYEHIEDNEPAQEPENSVDNIELAGVEPAKSALKSPEQIGKIVDRVEKDHKAINALEQAHKRRETKNKRHIKKLKKEAKTAKKEREEIKKQQEEFERHIDKRIEKSQKDHNEKKQETIFIPPVEKELVIKEEAHEVHEKPPKEAKLREVIKQPKPEKPEEVLEIVEKAAEQNMPIEKLYEQRHEVKEKTPYYLLNKHKAQASQTKKAETKRSAMLQQHLKKAEIRDKQVARDLNKIAAAQPSMYQQAITSGFITGVALIAVITVMFLLF